MSAPGPEANPAPSDPLRPMRLVSFAMLAGTLMACGVVGFVIKADNAGATTNGTLLAVAALVVIAAAAAVAALITLIGKARPLPRTVPAHEAQRAALGQLSQTLILRGQLAAAPAIFSIAMAFVAHSRWVIVLGLVLSIGLWIRYGRVTEQLVREVQAQVEANGLRTGLAEALGFGSGPSPHQVN